MNTFCLLAFICKFSKPQLLSQIWRAKCQINQPVKGSTGEWRMCHTSPLRAWARQGPARCVGLIKLDCLAIIRARCGQALAMVVRLHLLCRGGGVCVGRKGWWGRGHSWLTSDPAQGRTTSQCWQLPWTRQATCYHLPLSQALRALSRCLLYSSFKALVAFIQCFKVGAALAPSDFSLLLFKFLFCSFIHPFVLGDNNGQRYCQV